MKKRCIECGSDLYVIKKPHKTGTGAHYHLFCSDVECGKHNQFCSSKEATMYEEREYKKEENQQQMSLL